MALGDLDGDFDLDVAVPNQSDGDISVLLNAGDGTLASTIAYPVDRRPFAVAIGDMDGDLDLDLVVASDESGTVSVLRNSGSGSFAADVPCRAGDRPRSLAIGDLDGDLDLDLATANSQSDDVSVLLNYSAIADFDGDGNVGPMDLQRLCAAWGKRASCPQDLNGDGEVGGADLSILLQRAGWLESRLPTNPAFPR